MKTEPWIQTSDDNLVIDYGSEEEHPLTYPTDRWFGVIDPSGSIEIVPTPTYPMDEWISRTHLSGSQYAIALFESNFSSSPTLTPAQLKQCKKELKNLLETAGKPDWDGEDADPVTEDVIKAAEKVIDELPGDSGVPEISADPEGNVEFDWHLDNGTMFTVCIGQTGIIVISGLHPTKAELTVTAKDKERVPSILRCGLEWLNEMKSR